MVLSKLLLPHLPRQIGFLYCKRHFSMSNCYYAKLKVAVIGQSTFAAEVYKLLVRDGHQVVGVFTVPDQGSRQDPLATIAQENDTPVFKIKSWQKKGVVLPEVYDMYKDVKADLNVLPFCIQFIPMDVINFPKHKSICYHPSILPKHRGVSAISWTLIEGDKDAGFTVFWPDEGLDTGPILLQRRTKVQPNDTLDTLYSRFMYPEGITAMAEAVNMVAAGSAPQIVQPEEGASYEPSLKKGDVQLINWSDTAKNIHNFIRGLDSSPGARGVIDGKEVRFFGSTLWRKRIPRGKPLTIQNLLKPAVQHAKGLLIQGTDGKFMNVERLSVEGKMVAAAKYGSTEQTASILELTEEDKRTVDIIRDVWKSILNIEIENSTDFFKAGGGSMDVVRLVEEVKEKIKVEIQNQDVFMATTFEEFFMRVFEVSKDSSGSKKIEYDAVELHANNINLRFPNQLFINGEFVNSESGQTFETVNPADESVICQVQSAGVADVDRAVEAAAAAFEDSEWTTMSARDRGRLLFQLADVMEANKEELATLEGIDAGAVYTLALKTHIGMSIETWRYFAGWTDKIQGNTIPITNARPNKNLTYTKREPIGVCGLITPWNYPLMMLSWKMAACLAAGNTVVIKPAEVTPLTALKFAELSLLAGIPPGVINVVPGPGRVAGEALARHALVRKIGFTGSTRVGHDVMRAAADSNLKKVSLELGGKSPLIIFSDADLDRAVRLAIQGVFFNKGENCIAAGRIFVESEIHDAFVDRVKNEVEKIKISDPFDRSASHGPQNHRAHLDKLVQYVERGKEDGATLVCGGERLPRPGYYFTPAVFTNVTDQMFIAKEEAFGPIMVISRFDEADVEDVLQRANDTEYGLASGVFTQDINRALLLADKIEAGTVFINTYNKTDVAAPFGGFKMSGFGKDLGAEALNEYLKTKCVTIEY